MAELGFVRNESRPAAARRPQPHARPTSCSTPPTRSSPTSPRASRTRPSAPTCSLFLCNSDNRADRESAYLDRLEQQRVQGVLITPVDPDDPHARRAAAARHPGGDRRPDRDADDALLGGGRRRARRPARGRAPARPRATGGSPSSAARAHRAGARPAARARGRRSAAGRPRPTRTWSCSTTDGADRRRGAQRRRAAGRHAQPVPAHRGVLRQRPAGARPAAAVRRRSACGCPEDLAIVGYDDIEFAAAAAVPLTSVRQPRRRSWAARPPSCCSTRRATRTTCTSRSSHARAGGPRLDPPALTRRLVTRPRYSSGSARRWAAPPGPGAGFSPTPRARPAMACVTPCV